MDGININFPAKHCLCTLACYAMRCWSCVCLHLHYQASALEPATVFMWFAWRSASLCSSPNAGVTCKWALLKSAFVAGVCFERCWIYGVDAMCDCSKLKTMFYRHGWSNSWGYFRDHLAVWHGMYGARKFHSSAVLVSLMMLLRWCYNMSVLAW